MEFLIILGVVLYCIYDSIKKNRDIEAATLSMEKRGVFRKKAPLWLREELFESLVEDFNGAQVNFDPKIVKYLLHNKEAMRCYFDEWCCEEEIKRGYAPYTRSYDAMWWHPFAQFNSNFREAAIRYGERHKD